MFTCVHRDSDFDYLKEEKLAEDRSNIGMFYQAVDPITEKSFVRNRYGYIRNDIQAIVEQTDMGLAQELISRLQQRQSDGISVDDLSDDQLLLGMKSKYQQTASEVTGYFERLLTDRDDAILLAQQKSDAEKAEADKKRLQSELFDSMSSEEKDEYLREKRKKQIKDTLIDD